MSRFRVNQPAGHVQATSLAEAVQLNVRLARAVEGTASGAVARKRARRAT